ncbi:MAG TPA: histidine kinase dimerization/phospho-acceptor domain-containing protein [Stenomitos sp.]
MSADPHDAAYAARPLHSALSGSEGGPGSVPTILVCPLPLPGLIHEQLLPELGHELKTPLTGIMGLAQVLQRSATSIAGREGQYATLIYQKSHQLLLAINDLFDLAQLCTHQFVLHLRPLEVGATLQNVVHSILQTAPPDLAVPIANTVPLDTAEQWMIGDQSRIEQLLTHLLGYLLAQRSAESRLDLNLRSHGQWIAITLRMSEFWLSAQEQNKLEEPPESPQSSPVPGYSSAVLKFLLARQLAQLHGGDIALSLNPERQAELLILFPRDLTHTTRFAQPDSEQPLFLVCSAQSEVRLRIQSILQAHDKLAVTAHSGVEARAKISLLSPNILILDGRSASEGEWLGLQDVLVQQSARSQTHLIWINAVPERCDRDFPDPLAIWSWPLPEHEVLATLQQLPTLSDATASSPVSVNRSPRAVTPKLSQPLVLLQIDQSSTLEVPEPYILEVLAQLSRDHGCSVLAVDDPDQAELLARIWKPKVMICPGSVPPWLKRLSPDAWLSSLPLFWLQTARRPLPEPLTNIVCTPYVLSKNPSALKLEVDRLYRHLVEAAFKSPPAPSP